MLLLAQIPPAVSYTVSAITDAGYTGFIIDADSLGAGPNGDRSVIDARAELNVTFNGLVVGPIPFHTSWKLVDDLGQAALLVTSAGPATSIEADRSVRKPASGKTVFAPLGTLLQPAQPLNPQRLYHLTLKVTSGGSTVVNESQVPARRYFEFSNTVSPDATYNVVAFPQDARISSGASEIHLTVPVSAARYDDFTLPPSSDSIAFQFHVQLQDTTDHVDVPLSTADFSLPVTIASVGADGNPVSSGFSLDTPIQFAAGLPLFGHSYVATVTLQHLDPDGTAVDHGNVQSTPTSLLALTGSLYFGSIQTTFTDLANDPVVGAVPDPAGGGVLTTLAVANLSGSLPGLQGLHYGDGTPLPVRIRPTGDAEYTGAGSVIVAGSANGIHPVGPVRMRYARLQLSTSGLSAFDAVALFPPGVGFGTGAGDSTLSGWLPLGGVPLDATLNPLQQEFSLSAADFALAALWVHFEQLPLRLSTPQIFWHVGPGSFEFAAGAWHFAREAEAAYLEDPARQAVLSPTEISRGANDQYLRFAQDTGGNNVLMTVNSSGLGILNAVVTLGGGTFTSHFPTEIELPVAGGLFQITGGTPDLVASHVDLVPGVALSMAYRQGCPDGICAYFGGGMEFLFSADENSLHLTPDGGLFADGSVSDATPAPARIEWGALAANEYAHSVGDFTRASIHFPGFLLGPDALATVTSDDAPGVLMNTGYGQPSDAARLERPNTPAYAEGLANYAGFNFRLDSDGAASAHSYIAGQRVPVAGDYPVKANSKYYARPAGVSGRHQAVAESFPHNLVLYGFPTSLSSLRISYLDNQVERSATDGGITVPYPSDFTQNFDELRLRCNGQLLDAKIQGDSQHTLAYWLAPFRALTLEFRGAATAPCDTTAGVLLLGSAVTLPYMKQPALGALGFHPDGNLVSEADGFPGVDSRLQLPPQLQLKGPEGVFYTFSPVTRAYFNSWPGAGGDPKDGFVSFAGKLDVPWFLDMKVHAHAIGGGANPLLYLMGGWNNNGKLDDPMRAWVGPARESFFTRQDFDAANRGYPDGVSVDTYRDSGTEQFRPRAQQKLLGLPDADLDLPVRWEPGSRSFVSAGQQSANLLVFAMQAEAARMSAKNVHLNFGAQVTRPPDFSASDFLMGQIDNTTSFFTTVSNAIVHAINDNSIASRLRSGSGELDRLVSPDLHSLIGSDLLDQFNDPVDQFLDQVLAHAQAGVIQADNFQKAICQELGTPGNVLDQFQKAFLTGSGLADTVSRRVANSIATADDAVTSAISIVELKEVEPMVYRRSVLSEIAKRVVQDAAPDAPPLLVALAQNVAPSILDAAIDDYVGDELEEPLAAIESALRDVHQELHGVVEDVNAARGDLLDGIQQAQAQLNAAGTYYKNLSDALCKDFGTLTLPVEQAMNDRVRLREQIKQAILDQLLSGIFPKELNLVFKQFLTPGRGIFRSAVEDLFAKVDDTLVGIAQGPLRDQVKNAVAGLDDGVTKGLQQLSDILKGTRLHGYADISGDDLKKLRVDGEFHFALEPADAGSDSSLSFAAFYQIEQFQGDSPQRGCRAAGGTFNEVSFGASASPGDGFAQGLHLVAEGRFSLDDKGNLKGLSGGLTTQGNKRIGGFTAKDPKFGFSFGDEGNYLGGSVAGSFKEFTLQARVFAGVACRLGDLDLIDSDTARLLLDNKITPNDPLAGFYVAGDLTIPLEKLLPIPLPSTCLLHVEARGGNGYFGFLVPPASPAFPSFLVGFRQRLGLKGELLCVLSGEGDLNLVGAIGINALGTPQATVVGTLKVGGKVGICPICDDVTKTFPWSAHLTPTDVIFDSPF